MNSVLIYLRAVSYSILEPFHPSQSILKPDFYYREWCYLLCLGLEAPCPLVMKSLPYSSSWRFQLLFTPPHTPSPTAFPAFSEVIQCVLRLQKQLLSRVTQGSFAKWHAITRDLVIPCGLDSNWDLRSSKDRATQPPWKAVYGKRALE